VEDPNKPGNLSQNDIHRQHTSVEQDERSTVEEAVRSTERTLRSLEKRLEAVQREIGSLRLREYEAQFKPRLDEDGKHVEVLNLRNEEHHISEENTRCERNTIEDYPLRDATDMVQFCVHAMGIPESQLTQEKLAQVGCRPSEAEADLLLLESKHLQDKGEANEAIAVNELQRQVTPEATMTLGSLEICKEMDDPCKGLSKNAKKKAKRKWRLEKTREESLADSPKGFKEAA